MTDFILTLVSAVLVNNFVLQQPLAVDPLLAETHSTTRTRLHALGAATCLVMFSTSLIGYLIQHYALLPLRLEYLRLFVFVPLIALSITPALRLLKRLCPTLAVDGLWPLLFGNAAVLGVLLLSSAEDQGWAHAVALSVGAGLGFWLVLGLFHDLLQRIDTDSVPAPFRGLPLQLISAGLMGLAFLAFNGSITA
jgi:electron transport complex protein RnfA